MKILEVLNRKVPVSYAALLLIGLLFYLLYQPVPSFTASLPAAVGGAWDNRAKGHPGHVLLARAAPVVDLASNDLPLTMQEFSLRAHVDIPLQGGAFDRLGDALLVLDRLGGTWLVSAGQVRPSGLPDLPLHAQDFLAQGRYPLDATTLQAHDIKVNPRDGRVYASFETFDKGAGATRFTIARAAGWPEGRPHWEILFQGPPLSGEAIYSGRAGGGKLAFQGDRLIFGIGDYSFDVGARPAAQDPSTVYGKIFSMDLTSGKVALISTGHRVQLGLTVAPDGSLWETENGPRGGDELNRIVPGRNYGWPYETLGQNYFSMGYSYGYQTPGSIGRALREGLTGKQAFEPPVYAWTPSIAISQLVWMNHFDPAWDGDLLAGALKGQSLYRIRMDHGRVLLCEQIWLGHRVRDILQDGAQILVWTDDGTILRLFKKERMNHQGALPDRTAGLEENPLAECANCHQLTGDASTPFGPNLHRVYGRAIASDHYPHYSPALRALKAGHWDENLLRQFIRNAPSVVPGTTMPALSIPDDRLDRMIRALQTLARS